jgi:hypothetical protein
VCCYLVFISCSALSIGLYVSMFCVIRLQVTCADLLYVVLFHIYVLCLIHGSSILNYCCYFKLLVYVLCICCGMLCLSVLCILVGGLSISFGRCHFCCVCLFMDAVSINFVLCSAFWMLFLFVCPWIILWFFLFLSHCVWKWPVLCSDDVGQCSACMLF